MAGAAAAGNTRLIMLLEDIRDEIRRGGTITLDGEVLGRKGAKYIGPALAAEKTLRQGRMPPLRVG